MVHSVRRDEHDPVGGPAQQTATVLEGVLMTALAQMKFRGIDDTSDHLYVATMAIGCAIQIAGKLMTMPEGDTDDDNVQKWASEPTSRVGTLIACLLVARCTKPDIEGHGIDFEFGPRHILAAIKAAELIVGHNIDLELTPAMVRAARGQPEPTHLFDNSETGLSPDLSKNRTLN